MTAALVVIVVAFLQILIAGSEVTTMVTGIDDKCIVC